MDRIVKDKDYRFYERRVIVKRFNLALALRQVTLYGKYLEFGVYQGNSINFIATKISQNNCQQLIYGFDCWQGLPEEWATTETVYPAGSYSTNNQIPEVEKNVRLVSGLFEDTLPQFCATHNYPTAFVHIDSDLYSSAKTIFKYLGPTLVNGTIIVFDDWVLDPDGEKKAFNEWLEETNTQATLLFDNEWQATFAIGLRE
jgi:hypothetical protein